MRSLLWAKALGVAAKRLMAMPLAMSESFMICVS
jgi:hypothetical protein